MKKHIVLISIILMAVSFIGCSNELIEETKPIDASAAALTRTVGLTDYYWYNGEKIWLPAAASLYYISSYDSLNLETANIQSTLSVTSSVRSGSFGERQKKYWRIVEIEKVPTLRGSAAKNAISLASKSQGKNIYIAPVFGTDENYIATSEFFYVKLNSNKDYQLLESRAKKFLATIVGEVDYMPDWYLLQSPTTSNGITMANQFYETGQFENVDVGFMFDFKPSCTSDPDFAKQWGLSNSNGMDINACNAWSITKGTPNVTLAILDTGVDQNHKEFANNYSSLSYDLHNKSSPSVVHSAHGTHVAGIAAANHNTIQIAGVAPLVSILSISHGLFISPTISGELASGFGYATYRGADVMNNSWGDQGGEYYNDMHSTILEDAIATALTSGRDGKGMVVVFASGNRSKEADYPGSFHPDILVVGSITSSGNKAGSSSYGEKLDVVAPGSDIWSTYPNNTVGYNSGTSMAAPHVAGIASLILSQNPNLTRKEVVDIIERTARKVGGYSYTTNSGRPNGAWNTYMGYGLVDAYSALVASMNDIVYFNNQTVRNDITINGWRIISENVIITNNAKVKFKATKDITINRPFALDIGSYLEIN